MSDDSHKVDLNAGPLTFTVDGLKPNTEYAICICMTKDGVFSVEAREVSWWRRASAEMEMMWLGAIVFGASYLVWMSGDPGMNWYAWWGTTLAIYALLIPNRHYCRLMRRWRAYER